MRFGVPPLPFVRQLGSLRCANGTSKTRNLLEFICAQLCEKSPDTLPGVISLLGDHVADAAAVSIDEIHTELLELQQGMGAMSAHLSATSAVDGVDDSMLPAQMQFIDTARYALWTTADVLCVGTAITPIHVAVSNLPQISRRHRRSEQRWRLQRAPSSRCCALPATCLCTSRVKVIKSTVAC
jgi:hypothetical protein